MSSTKQFSYEWQKFSQIIPQYEQQFLRWVHPLKPRDFKYKIILDAGCGTGRNSYWPLMYGAQHVAAFDYDHRTVAVARKNLKSFKNADIRYGSIYSIVYTTKFDITMSIGVIHHLQFPQQAITHLLKLTKSGGLLVLWVYGDSGKSSIVYAIKVIRKLTQGLSIQTLDFLAVLFALPLYAYLKLAPQKHTYFQLLSTFEFWHIRSIIFDQLIPEIAQYWQKDEVKKLFTGLPISSLKIYQTNANSWTVIAKKK